MTCKVGECDREPARRGWCKTHYSRWLSTGDPTKTLIGGWDETAAQRLARRSIRMPSGCVEWNGPCDKDGYGKFTKKGWPGRAHRAAYIASKGPIPVGALVRHTCDNPPCIYPDHLRLGDELDNATDRVQRGRFDRTSPRYNRVRLSMKEARDIRAKHDAGALQRALAQEYGVGRDQISRVVNNLNWKETSHGHAAHR